MVTYLFLKNTGQYIDWLGLIKRYIGAFRFSYTFHWMQTLFTHLISHSVTRSVTYSLTHSPNHSLTHLLSQSLNQSLTHPLTHTLTHLHTQSLTQKDLTVKSKSQNHQKSLKQYTFILRVTTSPKTDHFSSLGPKKS